MHYIHKMEDLFRTENNPAGPYGKSITSASPLPPSTPVGPAQPIFLKPLQHQPLKIGGSVVLECRVLANPACDVAWYKNGQPLQQGFR